MTWKKRNIEGESRRQKPPFEHQEAPQLQYINLPKMSLPEDFKAFNIRTKVDLGPKSY